jgi:hypothetical protein
MSTEAITIGLYGTKEPLVIHRSGRGVFRLDWPRDFAPEIIGHGLSLENRFTGQTPQGYSVAEHSVRLRNVMKRHGYHQVACRAALLHDAPECLGIGDMHHAVKHMLAPEVKELEEAVSVALWGMYGCKCCPWANMEAAVKRFDRLLGDYEYHQFMRPDEPLGKDFSLILPEGAPGDGDPWNAWYPHVAELRWHQAWREDTSEPRSDQRLF